jgi:hypothetical protein
MDTGRREIMPPPPSPGYWIKWNSKIGEENIHKVE